MDIQRIKELALANGFKLKEQASGNLDLNAYIYDFANAIEREVKAQAVSEGYVLMPIKPTKTMVMAVAKEHEGDAFLPYSLYDAHVKQAMIEAQEKNQ
jgi:hypothetical protein